MKDNITIAVRRKYEKGFYLFENKWFNERRRLSLP